MRLRALSFDERTTSCRLVVEADSETNAGWNREHAIKFIAPAVDRFGADVE